MVRDLVALGVVAALTEVENESAEPRTGDEDLRPPSAGVVGSGLGGRRRRAEFVGQVVEDGMVGGVSLARPGGAPVAVELADDGAGFGYVGGGGGVVPVEGWVGRGGRGGGGGEVEGCEAGGQDPFGDVGVAGDGGVDGVEGGEEGDGG